MATTNDGPAADCIENRTFDERPHLHQLLEAAKRREPLRTAVVHPVDGPSLLGALEATQAGLIEPILVGPEARIRAAAEKLEMDLAPYRLVPTVHSHEAAEQAVALVRSGDAEVLMKGSLHTDELMGAVVAKDKRGVHVSAVKAKGCVLTARCVL